VRLRLRRKAKGASEAHSRDELELATPEYIDWINHRRLIPRAVTVVVMAASAHRQPDRQPAARPGRAEHADLSKAWADTGFKDDIAIHGARTVSTSTRSSAVTPSPGSCRSPSGGSSNRCMAR
jgi:hypothetical protein